MADLLIKGMELPKNGAIKIGIDADGTLTLIGKWTGELYIPYGKYIGKVVEIPTHGRLIDADELLNSIGDYGLVGNERWHMERLVIDAPTVIEASEAQP